MTGIERRIVTQLGSLVVLVILIYGYWQFFQRSDAAEIAPMVTAGVALSAALVACVSIYAQRDIARRRASIDFFLKTEMDERALGYYREFKAISREEFQTWANDPNFAEQPRYHDVRAFLNICELIAVGIHEKAFSERVSYAYWGDVLPQTLESARPLIARIRATPGEGTRHTYSDLERLCRNWSVSPP